MDKNNWIWLLGGAAVLYWLYQQGYLAEWFGSVAAAPATTPVSPTTPASVSLASPVQLNSGSNSLSAQVSVNGAVQPVTLGISTGVAQDQNGNNITATLQSEGVNIPALLQLMQAAYSTQQTSQSTPAASSSTSSIAGLAFVSNVRATRVPAHLVHGGTRR